MNKEIKDKSATRDWLVTGTVIRNYVIESRIAASGIGEVYIAKHLISRREVALKILPAPPQHKADKLENLAQQLSKQMAFCHPAFCETHEVGVTEKGELFIASEYVNGHSLDTLMQAKASFDVEKIAKQVAVALQAAHESDRLHSDLKMSDIMLTAEGGVKILDLGLASYKQLWHQSEKDGISLDDKQPSSVRHFAPEHINGLAYAPQTDLFSLGTILFELVTGSAPFTGTTALKVCAAVVWNKPQPMKTLAPRASATLCASISRLLEKAPSERTPSAKAFLGELKGQKDTDAMPAKHFGASVAQAGKSLQRFFVTEDGRLVADFGKGIWGYFFNDGVNWAVVSVAAIVACYSLATFLTLVGAKH